MAFKFQCGDYVKDMITKHEGYITSRTEHLTRCNQYSVQPTVDKKKRWREGFWIDEACLALVPGKDRVDLVFDEGEPPG